MLRAVFGRRHEIPRPSVLSQGLAPAGGRPRRARAHTQTSGPAPQRVLLRNQRGWACSLRLEEIYTVVAVIGHASARAR